MEQHAALSTTQPKNYYYMYRTILLWLFCCCMLPLSAAEAKWITADDSQANRPNTWIAFQKDIVLKKKPGRMMTKIACDSKYWLWIKGRLVVFEGQLKRGPAPGESYYDEIDLGPSLRRGQNRISVLVWYFGKSGFSHADSGIAGLYIDAADDAIDTNGSWASRIHPAY